MTGLSPVGARGLTRASTAGSSSSDAWAFDVTHYGAVGDGSTDDTAAIQAAINAAAAYAVSVETRYAEVVFPVRPASYVIGGALVQGGTTFGNSQLTIPIVAGTARKVTLVLRGEGADAAAMPYWAQTTGQRWGVTLKSTLTGQTLSSDWGIPSVIGGPVTTGALATYGSSTFNNVCVVVDGIAISTPLTPTVGGFDFRGTAQVVMKRCAVVVDAQTSSISGSATNDWTVGLSLPVFTNNDRSVVEDFTVYGHYVGIQVGEHLWMDRAACIYCHDGIKFTSFGSDTLHSIGMGAISIEGCVDALRCYEGSGKAPVDIAALSTEVISGKHVNDSNNVIYGHVGLTEISGTIAVTGGGNLEIIAANQARGNVTAPGVPSSTVALVNPFYRHAAVTITGGTVSAIAVDGVATGFTATGATVVVPSGKSITLTYSAGPSWKWTLL